MTNTIAIIPTATYAAHLVEGNTTRQAGLISGAAALEMLANSPAPEKLTFRRIG